VPLRLPILALLALALAGPVVAATPAWTRTDTPAGEVLDVRWRDRAGAAQRTVTTFPAGTLGTAEVLRFALPTVMTELGARMTAWAARELPGLRVSVRGTKITLEAEGRTEAEVDHVITVGRAEKDRLYEALITERLLLRTGPNEVRYDHARIAALNAPAVAPLAATLGAAPDGARLAERAFAERAFAERALAFVQGIPYEAVNRDSFAPPLAVLRDPHADCDEKAVLYAALLRAAAPALPVAILTMEAHAVVGVGLPATGVDQTIAAEGVTWVLTEPAGPALHALGAVDARTRAALAQGVTLARVP
jgi:hypothetical protein